MANNVKFSISRNHRNALELVCTGEHIEINDLKKNNDIIKKLIFNYYSSKNIKYIPKNISDYLPKNTPDYPNPVEFHVTELAHVTNKTRLPEIWNSGGFKGFGEHSLSWWSLKINEADIDSAEERYLEEHLPNRSEEERAAQPPFLKSFTTSPPFLNESSRYGNFRFTFPLTELMEAYKKQMCDGEEPVLRVYGTKLFRQEIEYVVLVHSPEFNKKFSGFPLLSSSPLVDYKGKHILWQAQAVCEKQEYQLMINGNTAQAESIIFELYVWDQVSFVFHTNGILAFPQQKLKENLSCCKIDPKVNLANGEIFYSIEEAEKYTQSLPDDEFEKDEEEEPVSKKIKLEVE